MVNWKASFSAGVKAFREGNYNTAIDKFSEAIESGAEGHASLDSRSAAYERLGKYKEALVDSRQVIKLFPHLTHGYARSSRLLTQLGQHERAVALARSALERAKQQGTAKDMQNLLDNALIAQHNHFQELKAQECHITKLPFELLATVFEVLVHSYRISPVKLSHVCRHWSRVVHQVPGIWSRLVLDGRAKRHEVKTKFWMEKSRGKIRELHIHNAAFIDECLKQMGEDTVSHLETIRFVFDSMEKSLPKQFGCEADPLAFTWDIPYYQLTQQRLPFVPRGNAYRMTELELRGIALCWSIETELLQNLTTFIAPDGRVPVAELFKLLERSPNIQTLSVGTVSEPQPDPTARLTLSNLATLKLYDDASILQLVEVPAVETLHLVRLRSKDALQYLSPRCPPLVKLSVSRCSSLVGNTPLPLPDTLTSLELDAFECPIDQIVTDIAGGQCPKLEELHLATSAIQTGPIIRLVKARNVDDTGNTSSGTRPVAKLRSLQLERCEFVASEALPWLRAKVEDVKCVYEPKEKQATRIRRR